MIIREYRSFLETILYESLLHMKAAYHHRIIDSILLKVKKREMIFLADDSVRHVS